MILPALVLLALLCSALAAATFFANLPLFCSEREGSIQGLGSTPEEAPPFVSVLIPARDEEARIESSARAALASEGIDIEVVVLDDQSTDSTAAIVKRLAQDDSRVKYVAGVELPRGWNGKQHACARLAEAASAERLLFIDADVRLTSDAILRLLRYQDANSIGLLSAFPRQRTGSWSEDWLIPLMHYILLCFLPMSRMRQSTSPAYASGCGQLFFTRRVDYETAGTHAAIRQSRHDGLKLPRAYRLAGLSTDVIDGSPFAECRMYDGAAEVVRGVLKNAAEGIANPRLILVFTVLLGAGSVLPWFTGMVAALQCRWWELLGSLIAIGLSHLPRWVSALRFRQSLSGPLFHPFSILLFLILQWVALVQSLLGYQVAWRGRAEG